MAAYRRVDGFKSPAGWLPVHRDQLRAQRSVTSVGELYVFYLVPEDFVGAKFTCTHALADGNDSAYGLGKRRQNSPKRCHLHRFLYFNKGI